MRLAGAVVAIAVLLLGSTCARTRFAREASDVEGSGMDAEEAANTPEEAVVLKDAEEMPTEDENMEEENNGDVEKSADDEAEDDADQADDEAEAPAIKDENIDKCNKCLKPEFKYRHDNFCGKCKATGVIDPAEAAALEEAINCRKCEKPRYRARHEDLCLLSCTETTPETTPATTTTTTEAPTTTEVVEEEEEEIVDEETEDNLEALEQNKNRKRKNKKKNKKDKLNKNKVKFATTNMEVADSAVPEPQDNTPVVLNEQELGPLGNLIKYLVVKNTFV